jgi:FdhD protein
VPSTRIDLGEPGDVRLASRPDTVAVEEPLEIRVDGTSLSVTMRTPGDDFDLAIGYLLSEGVIEDAGTVRQAMHCLDEDETGSPTYNVVDITLQPGTVLDTSRTQRSSYTSSACGVCGKTSIDAITAQSRYAVADDGVRLAPETLAVLPDALRTRQKVFDRTGGLHAAALFDTDAALTSSREDVGRHNAVDKVVGAELMAGSLPLSDRILLVSGRASFEILQKAAVAGIPIVCAVSAPSSLAVDAARRFGVTLVGFLRDQRFNVYSHPERIAG